jgi:hypothetical protein
MEKGIRPPSGANSEPGGVRSADAGPTLLFIGDSVFGTSLSLCIPSSLEERSLRSGQIESAAVIIRLGQLLSRSGLEVKCQTAMNE